MRRALIALTLLSATLLSVVAERGAPAAAQSGGAVYVPVAPVRVLDTRTGGARLTGGGQYTVSLAAAGVPAGATAAAVNLTVTEPAAAGYLTLGPAGAPLPLTSNLNFSAGETTANHAIVATTGAEVAVLASVDAHVVLDVAGYWVPAGGPAAAGRFVPVGPTRVLDTRDGGVKLGPAGRALPLTGLIPADATGVAVNLTATEADADGYVTAWASGAAPFVSNVNYTAGSTIANAAIVPVAGLGGTPTITLLASAPTHLVVDVAGYFTGASAGAGTSGQFVAAAPSRVLDTRDGTGRLDPTDSVDCAQFDTWQEANEWYWTYASAGFGDPFGLDGSNPPDADPCEMLPGHPRSGAQPLSGVHARIPRSATIPFADPRAAGASAVVVNLTVTAPAGPGYVTAFPAGGPAPLASNINPAHAGHTRPGLAIVGTGTGGRVHVTTSTATHLVVDAAGWFL
ncbi:MAG: hypothetical protein AB7H93_25690 [Vicinamibacterales bacterium]